jgi:hypothetical protein
MQNQATPLALKQNVSNQSVDMKIPLDELIVLNATISIKRGISLFFSGIFLAR